MEDFIKYYLPFYILLYLAVAFFIPTYRTYKKTGLNPITFGKEDTAHNYIGLVMKILIALLFISVLFYSFGYTYYKFLVPITYLENQSLKIVGIILIHLSLLWIGIAQYQMSTSWRIGIDEKNDTELVTKGIFSISRNPIFLGMIVSVLGLFLITPNALTFFLTLSTYFVIQIQIRLEEEFLEKKHNTDYSNYKLKTKRLI
jgi:protein-S-isoprenylcysteine O-methyltransferase Ste14